MVRAEVEFDFRVPHVSSINCSGHKYGLVYPGVGWVVWRNRACVDESLICEPARASYILRCLHREIMSHSSVLFSTFFLAISLSCLALSMGLHLPEPCLA